MTALDGVRGEDVASGRNPYLAAQAVQQAQQQRQAILAAMTRRLRTAQFTPGGMRQPPEVAGVDADARVPNALQPEPGEITAQGEVAAGRPGFFAAPMPQPTGTTNNVGGADLSGIGHLLGHVTGAPVGTGAAWAGARPVGADGLEHPGAPAYGLRLGSPLAGGPQPQPGAAQDLSGIGALVPGVSGLPHFADGGMLAPGGTGIVGEQGEEAVTALPGGGAAVVSLDGGGTGGAGAKPDLSGIRALLPQPSRDLSALAALPAAAAAAAAAKPAASPAGGVYGGAPAAPSADLQRSLREAGDEASYGVTAPPPGTHTAEQSYDQAAEQLRQAALSPPQRGAKEYQQPLWHKLLGITLAGLATGAARNPNPAEGAAIYGEAVPDLYQRAEGDYQAGLARQQAALEPMAKAAQLEEASNAADARAWQQQVQQGYRQQAADQTADYRATLAQQRQQDEQDREQRATEEDELRRELAGARQPEPHLIQAEDGSYYAYNAATGEATPVTAGGKPLRGRTPGAATAATAANRTNPRYTQQAAANMLASGSRTAAEAYLQRYGAELAGNGADIAALQQQIDRRWPQPKPQAGGGLDLGAGAAAPSGTKYGQAPEAYPWEQR